MKNILKNLWGKTTKVFWNIFTYLVAALIIGGVVLIPVTVVAWCVEFWCRLLG